VKSATARRRARFWTGKGQRAASDESERRREGNAILRLGRGLIGEPVNGRLRLESDRVGRFFASAKRARAHSDDERREFAAANARAHALTLRASCSRTLQRIARCCPEVTSRLIQRGEANPSAFLPLEVHASAMSESRSCSTTATSFVRRIAAARGCVHEAIQSICSNFTAAMFPTAAGTSEVNVFARHESSSPSSLSSCRSECGGMQRTRLREMPALADSFRYSSRDSSTRISSSTYTLVLADRRNDRISESPPSSADVSLDEKRPLPLSLPKRGFPRQQCSRGALPLASGREGEFRETTILLVDARWLSRSRERMESPDRQQVINGLTRQLEVQTAARYSASPRFPRTRAAKIREPCSNFSLISSSGKSLSNAGERSLASLHLPEEIHLIPALAVPSFLISLDERIVHLASRIAAVEATEVPSRFVHPIAPIVIQTRGFFTSPYRDGS